MVQTATTLTNRDVLAHDPADALPNQGVAKLGRPRTPAEWDVLKFELQSFVCEGEYAKGLERILSAFIRNLDRPTQPAAWVSGFYGSGKSHFVRVLQALWQNLEFPDGARAHGLVQNLTAEITAALRELTTEGTRVGGLWSAAGTLSAKAEGPGSPDTIRLALLRILFQAADLPAQYAPGRFVLWLRQEGLEHRVDDGLRQRGRSLEQDVNHLYVSVPLGESLVEALPGFAGSAQDALQALRQQFPHVPDITQDEMIETMRDVLALQSGKRDNLPLTLIVWDELQQFIGGESQRTLQVQELVEACSSQFGSRLLFVGTGQSALPANTELQKLRDRFTLLVHLTEQDVDEVVRRVVLSKKPDAIPPLTQTLDDLSGEIDRQLVGTKIGPTAADRAVLVSDYPLLPTRLRFWEHALRAVDQLGTAGQLRTQLRIVQETTKAVAELPLGCVIPGDAIFDQIKADMLQTGVMLREIEQTIADQRRSGKPDGELRARLLATIFLITQLPTDGVRQTGLRATPEALADLLVDDLPAGSTQLREEIPRSLAALADEGTLMLADGQYRLQTRESQEWERDFRGRALRIRSDDVRIASDRGNQLRTVLTTALKGVTLVQGVTKTKRDYALHFGVEAPPTTSGTIPIWVRDQWTIDEKIVRDDAQRAGTASPVVLVFLPRRNADALKEALSAAAAAEETLEIRPQLVTDEARHARNAMLSRAEQAKQDVAAYIKAVIDGARVFQGGGNEVIEATATEAIKTALLAAMERLFPKFGLADQPGWDTVVKRANQGAPDSLAALGYQGEVSQQPVCQEIRAYLTGAAKNGTDLLKHFADPPYGWSKEVVAGAVLALIVDGQVRASLHGKTRPPKELTLAQIGPTEYVRESQTVTMTERLALRELLKETTGPVGPGGETTGVPELLARLIALGQQAGGPPPLPAAPPTDELEEVRALQGNALLLAVFERRQQLQTWYHDWTDAGAKAAQRLPRWQRLQALLRYANGVPAAGEIAAQAAAIEHGRSLLVDPDPVTPLIGQLTDTLRAALQAVRTGLVEARKLEIAALETSPEWQQLTDQQWRRLLEQQGLGPISALNVGTEEALLYELERAPLPAWEERIAALPSHAARAREAAAKMLQPQAIALKPPPATLITAAEVDIYLAKLRQAIMTHIEQGKPVIL